MFDKNVFKDKFRVWSERYPLATLEEIEKFFNFYIPEEFREKYAWLVNESLSWFRWKQENLQRELQREADEVLLKN